MCFSNIGNNNDKFFEYIFLIYIRTSGKSINFDNKIIKKSDFYKNKKLLKIENIDINKIFVSKKGSYDTKNATKYFIGYNDNDEIKAICIRLPQMIGYVKYFDDNKATSFKVTDKKLLNKYNKIWKKVEELLNVKFESKPIYGEDDKCIKAKIKSYQDKVNTNFQGKKTPKETSSYKCLSIVTLESILKVNKKYHHQILLDVCKYEVKNKKVETLINDDLELTSSDSESDNE